MSKQLKTGMAGIRKQLGMTLMEIIAALAIIAAVIVGALSLFNSAQSSNQSVTMLKNVIAIRSAIQQLYLGQGTYQPAGFAAGGMNLELNNSRKAPSDLVFINAAQGFRTPWGGTLSVAPGNAVGGTTPNFTITLTNVPPEVCSQLVTSASSGWSQTSVGGAVIGNIANAANPYPITPGRANAACGAAAGGVNVIFTTVN
ncbi:MAG: prepilin-type N-terminal cleavage/methylation domain-containing protein [Sterolibacterium sp.]|nr:prepilin-type N-terminal cleavage/methylation domain-containing protein [Sterolibacterium sp.]